ncbi:NADase-type glycan-binding domain-containing protein [Streptomyces sp. NPDC087270]|uniref:NADase-type glycan-binding domain-containing protein n=1 Tax=Streptomyces sp. NPDC087270 TaxID=3365774 RepID=UPI003814EE6A
MTGRSYDAEPPRPRARTCAECGTQAGPDQSFCDGCGAVLGWAEPPAASSARRPSEAPLSAAAGPAPAPAAAGAGAGPLPPAASEGAGAAGAGGFPPPSSGGGSPYAPPGSGAGSGAGAGRPGAEGAGPTPPRAGEGTGGRGFGGGAGQDVIEDPGAKSAAPIGGTGGGQESWGEVPRQGQPPVAEWQAAAAGPAPDAGAGAGVPGPGPGPGPGGPGARTDPMEDTLEQPPATDPQYPQAQPPATDSQYPQYPQAQQPPHAQQPPQPQQPPQSPSAEERARALLIPVADPQQRPAAAPSVGAVMPGRPVAARPLVRTPGELPDDDGPAGCPWCQTGNRVERHFCRRCAMPMSGRPQDDLVRRPWWRRLLDFFRRRETPWAGDRPRLGRNLGRVVTWLVGAGAAALVVVGAMHIDDGVRATQDHFAKRASVVPDSMSASHSYPGHGPKLAFDEYNNTWWGPGISESGAGEWLEAKFIQPVHLLDLVITPGESTQPADLQKSAEPHQLDVTVTTADGRTIVRHITLDQGSGGQTVSFRATKVTSVRFTVRSSYGIDKKKQVAIAEIEFFGPKHSN